MAHRVCVEGLTWDCRVYKKCVQGADRGAQGMTRKAQEMTEKYRGFSYDLRILEPVVLSTGNIGRTAHPRGTPSYLIHAIALL